MAWIKILDDRGIGLDMTGASSSMWLFNPGVSPIVRYAGTQSYDWDTNYDLYDFQAGSSARVGVFYRLDHDGAGPGIVVEAVHYYNASNELIATWDNAGIHLSYDDLRAGAVSWLSPANSGNDRIEGNHFVDRLWGGRGDDFLNGNAGNDRLYGETGLDHLVGGSGSDWCSGGAEGDRLDGGGGHDTLYGGDSDDTLRGGTGADLLAGGSGADDFVYATLAEAGKGATRDKIVGWTSGIDDINLRAVDANVNFGGNQNFQFSGAVARSHSVWAVDVGVDLLIRGDVTGDRVADFEIQLVGVNRVVAGDLIL